MGKTVPLLTFLQTIQQRKCIDSKSTVTAPVICYTEKEAIWDIDLQRFKKIYTYTNVQSRQVISLPNYILAAEFLILDIAYTNINTRPIYFTSTESPLIPMRQTEGLVNRLVPLDKNEERLTADISYRLTKRYVDSIFQFRSSADSSGGEFGLIQSDAQLSQMYTFLLNYYLDMTETDSAKALVDKYFSFYQDKPVTTWNDYSFAMAMLLTDRKEKARLLLDNYIRSLYQLYLKPSALEIYVTKGMMIEYLQFFQQQLEEKGVKSEYMEGLLSKIKD
jgi:hypothetical protein